MSVDLSNVKTFGGIDADTDALLQECFENHEAYLSARNREKFVILGRKGSGKTAIFRKIIGIRSHNFFSFGHTFSDYPWHHHEKQKKAGVPEEQCFLHSWEYLIYITLAKILLNQDQSLPWDEASVEHMANLETFVIDTYGTKDPDVAHVFSPARTLKLKGEFGIDLGPVKGKMNAEGLSMEYLPVIVQEVNHNLMKSIIECANPDHEYFICFDELDLGFSRSQPTYSLQLTGLLLASRKINNFALQHGKKVSIIIFLRDDIYQTLHFEDMNKITQNSVATIAWDEARSGSKLKSLMEKRFAKVFSIPELGSWEEVFDETREMTGHQSKYQHILDRTFIRPRDIIRFCNEILSVHQKRNDAPPNLFDNKDVIEARPNYSAYLLDELADELPKHIPQYKAYLEILKTINSLQFTYEEIEEACTDRKEILPDGTTARQILSQLFEFSVIGYYRPGGGGFGGAEYVWRHKDRRAMFNENAASYRIHAGLMEVLGVKKFTRSS